MAVPLPLVWFRKHVGGSPSTLCRAPGGTGTFVGYPVDTADFDLVAPRQAGAIAFRLYSKHSLEQQGHTVLYVGSRQIIKSIPSEGVTDRYTDEQTYAWVEQSWSQYAFTVYGFFRCVQY